MADKPSTSLTTNDANNREKQPSSPLHHNRPHHDHQRHQRHQQHQQRQQQQHGPTKHRNPSPNSEAEEDNRIVLIAMDGSAHSFYAFDWYMFHLHTARNEVIVAHSCPSSSNLLAHAQSLMPSVMIEEPSHMSRNMAQEEEVNQIVAKIKGRLATSGVRGKIIRLSGDPGSAIVNAAKEVKAICIVTGSRGLGTVKRTLIGSVSDYILHHSHCPVLVCRHKEN